MPVPLEPRYEYMRPKVVAGILFLAIGILGAMFLVSRAVHNEVNGESRANAPVAQRDASHPPGKVPPQPSVAAPVVVERAEPESPPVVAPVVEENPEVYSQQRVAELMALAVNNDSNSLYTICSELTNPDKEIRAGALAAVVQFDDRSVVPYLRRLAEVTSDPFEKVDITKAADQLALPQPGEPDQSQPGNGQQNGQ